jgi:CDP-2,3-bis-(O-geranylgeranyl)-sn-glycerol synthase
MWILIKVIWLLLPAYVPNTSAALIKGKIPMDFGRKIFGKRIFGDGKTYRGFFGGAFCGIGVGILQNFSVSLFHDINFLSLPPFPLIVLFSLAFGAMLGDLTKSFLKRRVGIERGRPLPVVDQLDFLAGAWILLLILADEWFFRYFTLEVIILALIITPFLHLSVNAIGYKLGKKDVWW